MKKLQLIILFFLFLTYILATGIRDVYAAKNQHSYTKIKKSQVTEISEEEDEAPVSSSGKGVISKSPYIGAIAIDAATGKVLFEDNADVKGFPASIIKLMNLLVVLDAVKEKTISLEDKVTITAEASRIGGSQVFLKEKEVSSVNELLYALMIQSANDAAVALALHVAGGKEAFVDLMNKKALELGMKNTQFHSVHGLPPGKDQHPDISTPRDIATLSLTLSRYPEVLEYTSVKERAFRMDSPQPFIMRNHNHLLVDYEGCDGLKTGYFRNAGFSISATASKKGQRVIAVVMGSVNRKVRDAKAKEILSKGLMELIKTSPQSAAPVKSQSLLKQEAIGKKQSQMENVRNETKTNAGKEEEQKDTHYTIQISKSFFKVVGGILVAIIFLIIGVFIGRKKRAI